MFQMKVKWFRKEHILIMYFFLEAKSENHLHLKKIKLYDFCIQYYSSNYSTYKGIRL